MIRKLTKWFVRVAWLLWLLVMLLIGLKIGLDNGQTVQVTLFNWRAPSLSLGFTLCFALLCGVVLGWFVSAGPYLLARQRTRRLERQLRQTQGEVSALRTEPLKP